MSATLEAPALATDTLGDDELCHALDTTSKGIRRSLCGVTIPADEPFCCTPPAYPSCNRPKCPECTMIFKERGMEWDGRER